MIKKLTFGTTNEGKLSEAREILDIEIEGVSFDADEIQSLDTEVIAIDKAKKYFQEFNTPIFVEDTSLTFHALGRLPGTLATHFEKELKNQGLIDLLQNKKDRSAEAEVTVCYIWDEDKYKVFHGIVKGTIADAPRGDNGFGWDPIFIPEGETRTFAEIKQSEKNKYSMRRLALLEFKKWLDNQK